MIIVVLLWGFKFGDSGYKIKTLDFFDILLFQSWGFFTNDPMYSNLYHYKVERDKIVYMPTNTSSINALFGIKRDIKRRNEAFNFVYKTLVHWEIKNYKNKEEILNDIKSRDKIDFRESRSKLEKGIYLTKKIETLKFSKIDNEQPRQAIYIFEVK